MNRGDFSALPGGVLPGNPREVRAYVTGADHTRFQQLAQGMVQVHVSHSNLRQLVQDLRLDLHSTIAQVKTKLYTHNGTAISCMELHLRDEEGNTLCRMLDDDRMLGFYGCKSGYTIHVVDLDPTSLSRDGGLDDVSGVVKYRMSEEEYDQRENTYRNFKRKQLEKDPTWRPVHGTGAGVIPGAGSALPGRGAAVPASNSDEFLDASCAAHVTIGQRCSVSPGDRRGEVCYIGLVKGLAAGYWVGVRLDEPQGKNDGTMKDVRYFEAGKNFGSFVRPTKVQCGDYPEKGLDEEEEEEEEGGGGRDDEL
jgi:tubulin-specific chaperone B